MIPFGLKGGSQFINTVVALNDKSDGEETPRGSDSAVVPRVLELREHPNTVHAST